MRRLLVPCALATLSALIMASSFAELLAANTPWFARGDQGFSFLPIVTDPTALGTPPGAGTEGWFVWWLFATRQSFGAALVSALLAVLTGTLLGLFASFGPAAFDTLLARLVEFGAALPALLLAPILQLLADLPLTTALVASIAVGGSLETARSVRGHVRSADQRGFVTASRALGGKRMGPFQRHILGSLLEPVSMALAMTAAALIGLEAALHFLDLSEVPLVSWGAALASAPFSVRSLLAAVSAIAAVVSLYLAGSSLQQGVLRRAHTGQKGASVSRRAARPSATG